MVQIRMLEADDAADYRALRLQALSSNPEAFLTTYDDYLVRTIQQVTEQLKPSDNQFTFGLFSDDGELAGAVTLVREERPKIQHIAHVFAMFVLPHFRRNGFGRMLLAEAINRAQTMPSLLQLKLSVIRENAAAISLYESLGFVTCGFEPQALQSNGQYFDEVHMVLPIGVEKHKGQYSMPITKGFSHVTIDVSDLKQSLEFYAGTLGMKVVHHGRRDAYLEWGFAWVCLQERPEYLPVTPSQLGVDHVAFYIRPDEFASKVEVLKHANVRIVRGPVERGGGWTVNFLDPDGTQLELHTGSLAERMKVWI